MTPTDAAYLAGVVDGEGSIIIAKTTKRSEKRVYNPTYSPILVVANTSLALIDWCVARGAVLRRTKR